LNLAFSTIRKVTTSKFTAKLLLLSHSHNDIKLTFVAVSYKLFLAMPPCLLSPGSTAPLCPRQLCHWYTAQHTAVYMIVYTATGVVSIAAYRPCTWPYIRPCKRLCTRLSRRAISIAVYRPCPHVNYRVHGRVRAVYTAVYGLYTRLCMYTARVHGRVHGQVHYHIHGRVEVGHTLVYTVRTQP